MSIKNKFCIISFFCAVLMLTGGILPAFGAQSDDISLWDYSRADRVGGAAVYSPSHILSLLCDGKVSEEEAAYLDTYHADVFLLDERISNDKIRTEYTDGVLHVSASPYAYEAKNGAFVCWHPVSATLSEQGATVALSASGEGSFSSVSGEGEPVLTVTYRCEIRLPQESANSLLLRAYEDATQAEAMARSQEEAFAAYEEAYRLYRAYLSALEQYESDLLRYEQYLRQKESYDRQLAAYEDYLQKQAAYEKACEAYAAYEKAMEQYRTEKAAYDRAYAAYAVEAEEYRAYYAKLNGIRERMYVMESLFTRPTNGVNALYHALQNKELISAFENNRNDIIRLGADGDMLDGMLVSADELNGYLQGYNEARDRSEAEAFAYYCTHYEKISTLFKDLYDRMSGVMTAKIFRFICAKIQVDYEEDPQMASYKKWRVKNVLAQIYLVSMCLDDSRTASDVWNFYTDDGVEHPYAFRDLLAANVLLTDVNASSPAGLVWPEEVKQPIAPVMPQEPARVTVPLQPERVEKPTLPQPMQKPSAPQAVKDPGEPPLGTGFLVQTMALLEAYREGKIPQRQALTEDATLCFTASVEKRVSFDNLPVVTVYGTDGRTVLSSYVAQVGDTLCPPAFTPAAVEDPCFTYVFSAWSLSDVTEMTVEGQITQDVCIFALSEASLRTYTVTWENGTQTETETYTFGQMPQYNGKPTKESDATTVYTFTEWYPLPAPVRADVTYTAQYRESERQYTVRWEILGETVQKTYSYGHLPVEPAYPTEYIEGNVLVRFDGWSQSVAAVTADVTYRANYRQTVLATAASGDVRIALQDGTLTVTTASDSITLASLLDYAGEKQYRVQLMLGETALTLDRATVSELKEKDVSQLSVKKQLRNGYLSRILLHATGADGENCELPDGIRVRLPQQMVRTSGLYLYARLSETVRMLLAVDLDGESLTFLTANADTYELINRYRITVVCDGRGTAVSDPGELEAGQSFRLFLYPNSEFCFDNAEIFLESSRVKILAESTSDLIMPEEDITVYVYFKPMRYTVTFMANDEIVSQREYALGAAVHIPEMEESFERDGYRYTFLGWTPVVMRVAGNTTYVARYSIVPIGETVDMGERDAWESVKVHYVYPIVAGALAAVAAVLITVYSLQSTKRRKAKK